MGKTKSEPEGKKTMGDIRLILVVDHGLTSSFYASVLLQRLEYSVYTVKTVEDAMEIMDIHPPSVILTELAMPKKSGLELLKLVKRDPKTSSIPVIIYANGRTREKDSENEKICRQTGCAAYLVKPVDPNALYAAIQKATEPNPRSVIRLKTRLCMSVEEEEAARNETVPEECITYLSEGGVYISTEEPQPPGTVLPIIFTLKNITIRVEGIVLYSFSKLSRPTGQHGMGLKFINISPRDKDLIRTFIVEQLTGNIVPKWKGVQPF